MPSHYTYKCTACNRTEERYRNARKSRCCHADVVRLTAVVKTQIELDLEDCRAEIERVHQYLDECGIGGDGTEPLLERVGQAVRAAYVQGCTAGGDGWPGAPAE